MRVRTVTVFVEVPQGLRPSAEELDKTIAHAKDLLDACSGALQAASYEVQTTRVAMTDPSQWLVHWPRQCNNADDAGSKAKRAKATLLSDDLRVELQRLDGILKAHGIDFFNLGCLQSPTVADVQLVPEVLLSSSRFNMSVNVSPGDLATATAIASAVQHVARHSEGGLGNFRLCACACCADANIPFFPAGSARMPPPQEQQQQQPQQVTFGVAVGLENGDLTREAAARATVSARLPEALASVMLPHLQAVERTCREAVETLVAATGLPATFAGIDTSYNPSLDAGTSGSVAAALSSLADMAELIDLGALGAVSIATTALQALPVQQVGYRGLMLPVCEDRHLAALAAGVTTTQHAQKQARMQHVTQEEGVQGAHETKDAQEVPEVQRQQGEAAPEEEDNNAGSEKHQGKKEQKEQMQAPALTLQRLLLLSSVCGVGVDTAPIPGDFDPHRLALLYLDMSGLAHRWNKPLSCRVFPVPGKAAGDMTTFDSPYLVNTRVLPL
ncbi:hypothetical protein PTSG_07905 [Salpingoeca rosetta]|uniref:DUF711 domain-containing protein n=1 Tax=Salpingoeca rosetta (strain ATCC 50818 / BSB-021) TaxID=946362 RepID=F2UGN7_SALR5|nr:uncharacterized protein PTSG_07905 [Salpingoeca rosetta]EGD75787.1 hypothetical protein PTSG_07905 [Salpingoeca rosetta]|eukprot:XP_004991708.1 hypothetical protein PTSG_07905 [Salpingoeca rosetta]